MIGQTRDFSSSRSVAESTRLRCESMKRYVLRAFLVFVIAPLHLPSRLPSKITCSFRYALGLRTGLLDSSVSYPLLWASRRTHSQFCGSTRNRTIEYVGCRKSISHVIMLTALFDIFSFGGLFLAYGLIPASNSNTNPVHPQFSYDVRSSAWIVG